MVTPANNSAKPNYLVPFIIMVVLMALIGLITNLNQQFQAPMQAAYLIKGGNMTNTLATVLNFAFFLAYLVMGPISTNYIEKKGYKKTLILGLGILIVGFAVYMLSAWYFDRFDMANFAPAIEEAKAIESEGSVAAMQAKAAATGNFAVNTTPLGEFSGLTWQQGITLPVAYWIFLIAAFIAGTALTYLQAVVNPYLVACDVPGTTGVQRQNISGAGNSLMTTLGPLFVAYLIFNGKGGLEVDITSLYIPIFCLMILVAVLAVVLSRTNLPEIEGVSSGNEKLPDSIWSFRQLSLGLVALFFYVGVEVCVGANIVLYAMNDLAMAAKLGATLASFYWGGMLVGRLLGSFLNKVSARTQLNVSALVALILVILSMVTQNPYFLCAIGLFHSVMWPSIFTLSLNGLGRYTSKASGILMMGCFGGALLPVVQGLLADIIGWNDSWLLVAVGEAIILFYALWGCKPNKRDVAPESTANA